MSFRFATRTFWIVTLALCLMFGVLTQLHTINLAEAEAPATASLDLQESNTRTLSFSLHLPQPHIDEEGHVTVTGLLGKQTQFGVPDLPYRQTLIALPRGTTAEVSIVPGPAQKLHGVDVRPVGRPQTTLPPDELPTSTDQFVMDYTPDTAVYEAAQPFPNTLYTTNATSYQGVPLLDLALYPVRYNPVAQTLTYYETMDVTVRFVPTAASRQTPASHAVVPDLEGVVLNPEHTAVWTPLTQLAQNRLAQDSANITNLPVGETVIKIGITETGIHELTADELATAGLELPMPLADVYLAYEGEAVARDIADNNNNGQFDSGDTLRFYGWEYDTTRGEGTYIIENVFWLWANESAGGTAVASEPSIAASTVVTQFQSTETFAQDRIFYYTVMTEEEWADSPNEPDIWYWNNIYRNDGLVPHPITLTHPVTSSSHTATFSAEVTTVSDYRGFLGVPFRVDINGQNPVTETFQTHENNNIVTTLPMTDVLAGTNVVHIAYVGGSQQWIFGGRSNEITAVYWRHLQADQYNLQFDDLPAGTYNYQISGFAGADAADLIVWDTTERLNPVQINGFDHNGDVLSFGRTHDEHGRFITTHASQLKSPASLNSYAVPDLTPADGYADWLVFTHADFLPYAQQLAAHRATASGYKTQVLDVQDVFNQYGNGHPTPHAIQNYIRTAAQTWPQPPRYVVLLGDADQNPRLLDCTGAPNCTRPGSWDYLHLNDRQVPTFFSFTDPFVGMVPSDYYYTFLDDSDIYPDLAVGRIGIETEEQASNAVNKIISYEENLLTVSEWQKRIALYYDNTDQGGDFKASAQTSLALIPDNMDAYIYGLESANGTDYEIGIDEVRSDLGLNTFNGYSLVGWTGHGTIDGWADEGVVTPSDYSPRYDDEKDEWVTDGLFYNNVNRPGVTVSFNCYDGYFTYPAWTSVAEGVLRTPNNSGSAAHWSAVGLGYLFDHTVLRNAFFQGLFEQNIAIIGDVTNYAKASYLAQGRDPAEAYAYNLQGDPAMPLYKADLNLSLTAPPRAPIQAGDQLTFEIMLSNEGNYPWRPTITQTLPSDLTFVSAKLADNTAVTPLIAAEGTVVYELLDQPIGHQESRTITAVFEATAETWGVTTVHSNGADVSLSPPEALRDQALLGDAPLNNTLFLPLVTR